MLASVAIFSFAIYFAFCMSGWISSHRLLHELPSSICPIPQKGFFVSHPQLFQLTLVFIAFAEPLPNFGNFPFLLRAGHGLSFSFGDLLPEVLGTLRTSEFKPNKETRGELI